MSRKYGNVDIIIGGSSRDYGRGDLDWPARFREMIMRLRRRLDETLFHCPPGEYREIALDQWIVCRRAVDEYRSAAGHDFDPLTCSLIELLELELQRNTTRATPGAASPKRRSGKRALFEEQKAAHPKVSPTAIKALVGRQLKRDKINKPIR